MQLFDKPGHCMAVPRIACSHADLDIVERRDASEPESGSGKPCRGVNGLREQSDVLRRQHDNFVAY